jgi:hypothetical protein
MTARIHRSAIGTLINHESRQDPAASHRSTTYNTYLMPLADDTAPPRVFIGHNAAPGRLATLDEAWQLALEILALVDGLEA